MTQTPLKLISVINRCISFHGKKHLRFPPSGATILKVDVIGEVTLNRVLIYIISFVLCSFSVIIVVNHMGHHQLIYQQEWVQSHSSMCVL